MFIMTRSTGTTERHARSCRVLSEVISGDAKNLAKIIIGGEMGGLV
jgi:hypothetical protein